MRRFISYGRQCVEEDDVQAVMGVLRSDFLTQGPKVEEFEHRLAAYCRAKYAVAFSSGTAALHGAYFAAGLGEGDELIASPMTFAATTNTALYLGARPVFVDVEPDTGNIDPDRVGQAITSKTKAIAPVDYAGHPVDLQAIADVARRHKLLVIEDACHALGAHYRSGPIGRGRYSDMAVFSFHPVKAITTGEGGAVVTNNETFRDRLTLFRHHGMTKQPRRFRLKGREVGPWYYEMQQQGYNYRITDLHCALGISQLGKLDRFINRRREIAQRYNRLFANNPFFDTPVERPYARAAYHLYAVRLRDGCVAAKVELFERLRGKNIGPQVHYLPVYLHPYYQDLGYRPGLCPQAEDFYRREVSLPIFPALDDEEVDYVARHVLETLGELTQA